MQYQRFSTSGSKDIRVRIFEIVAKTQFLCDKLTALLVFILRSLVNKNGAQAIFQDLQKAERWTPSMFNRDDLSSAVNPS